MTDKLKAAKKDTAWLEKAQARKLNRTGFPNRYFPLLKDHIIIDETNSHFIHLLMGWKKKEYIYTALRHIEVKADGKVIIHKNNVDKPLEVELVKLGIPESAIHLAMEEQLETA